MAANSYSRYRIFQVNGKMLSIPSIPIPSNEDDVFIPYDLNTTRFDRIAAEYYEDDSYWWVLMMANPEYYFEFDIPYNTIIRVPLPLETVLYNFQQVANKYI